MTIMLLDDDLIILDSLQSRIDWQALGIDTVLTASNTNQARALWRHGEIDILLTDIEMPAESGLSFVQWLREREDTVYVALLTSYADFEYAQTAIALGSRKYFLKPIDYAHLTQGLGEIVEQVKVANEKLRSQQQGQFWQQNKQLLLEQFWARLLSQGSEAFSPDVLPTAQGMGLAYREENHFLPLLIMPEASARTATAGNRHVLFQEIVAMSEKALKGQGFHFEASAMLADDVWALVLCVDERQCSMLEVEQAVRRLQRTIGRELDQPLRMGIGEFATLFTARDTAKQLRGWMADSRMEVTSLRDARRVSQGYTMEEMTQWEALLIQRAYAQVYASVASYLDRLAAQGNDLARVLRPMREEFTAMLQDVLAHSGIEAHAFFADESIEGLYRRAIHFPAEMKRYAAYLIEKTQEYFNSLSSPDLLAKRLAHHIDTHFAQVITRNDLAELVYLNPDYMARLFKRETGLSVNAYLLERRLQAAKELLERSTQPVHAVSMQVGYSNFAYFSKMFRERMGMSPNEYRKRHNQKLPEEKK